MDLDYKIIGERLKLARNNKNLTQEALAEKIDVSVVYISRIERGNSRINLTRLHQICAVLDITEGQILNGAASNSNFYLIEDLSNLLKNCPSEKMKLIYEISKVIIEN